MNHQRSRQGLAISTRSPASSSPQSRDIIGLRGSPQVRGVTGLRPSHIDTQPYISPESLGIYGFNMDHMPTRDHRPTTDYSRPSHVRSTRARDSEASHSSEPRDGSTSAPQIKRVVNDTLILEIQRLESIIKEKSQVADAWRRKELDLENRVRVLVTENERLSRIIDENLIEIENWKVKFSHIVRGMDDYGGMSRKKQELEYEVDRLNDVVQRRVYEYSPLKSRRSEGNIIEYGLTRNRSGSASQRHLQGKENIIHLEGRMSAGQRDIARAEQKALRAIEGQTHELESLRIAYMGLEQKFNQVVAENIHLKEVNHIQSGVHVTAEPVPVHEMHDVRGLETDIHNQIQEIEHLKSIIDEIGAERENLIRRVSELEHIAFEAKNRFDPQQESYRKELESNVEVMISENERLKGMINEMRTERETLFKRIEELELLALQSKELENKLLLVISENDNLGGEKQNLMARLSELETVSQNAINFRNKVNALSQEKELLKAEIDEKVADIELLANKILQLQEANKELSAKQAKYELFDVERQISLNREKEAETNQWSIRHRQLEGDITELKREVDKHKRLVNEKQHKIDTLNAQTEKLNHAVLQKDREEHERRQKLFETEKIMIEKEGLENRIQILTSENDRLNNANFDHQRQYEDIKNKYHAYDSQRRQLEDVQRRLESEKDRLAQTIEGLTSEKIRLSSRVSELTAAIDESKARVKHLELENGRLKHITDDYNGVKDENIDLRRTVQEHEELKMKVAVIIHENERLNDVITENSNQLHEWEQKFFELDSQRHKTERLTKDYLSKEKNLESKIQQLILEVQQKERSHLDYLKQIEQLKEKCKISEAESRRLTDIEREFKFYKEEVLQKANTFSGEKRHLLETISEKETQIRSLESKIYDHQFSKENQISLQSSLSTAREEIERTRRALDEKSRDYDSLHLQVTKLRKELESLPLLEEKLQLIVLENERIQTYIMDLEKETEDWRLKYNKLEIQQIDYNGLKKTIGDLSKENEEYRSVYWQLKDENPILKTKLLTLERENERLLASNKNFEREVQDWRHRHSKLEVQQVEYDGLKKSIADLKRENEENKNKYRLLKDENPGLQTRLGLLERENDRLQQSVANLDKENTDLRKRYGVLEIQQLDYDGLKRTVTELTKENEDNRTKYWQLRDENPGLQARIGVVERENEKLRVSVSSYEKEVGDLRQKCNKLEVQQIEYDELKRNATNLKKENEENKTKYWQLKDENPGLQSQLAVLERENERLEVSIASLEKENGDLRQRYNRLEVQQLDYESLKMNITELTRENEENKTRYWQLKSENPGLQSRLGVLERENERLQIFATSLEKENGDLRQKYSIIEVQQLGYDNLKRSVADLTKENEEYKTKYWQFKDENPNLKARVDVLERENETLRNSMISLERENKDLRQKHSKLEVQQFDYHSLKRSVADLTKENEESKSKYFQLKDEYPGVQTTIGMLEHDKERLQASVTKLEREVQDWRLKFDKYEPQEAEFNGLKRRVEDLNRENEENKLRSQQLKEENAILHGRIATGTPRDTYYSSSSPQKKELSDNDSLQLETYKSKVKRLEDNVVKLLDENQKLNSTLEHKLHELAQFKVNSNNSYQRELTVNNSEIRNPPIDRNSYNVVITGTDFEREAWKQRLTASADKAGDSLATYGIRNTPGSYAVNDPIKEDWEQRLIASESKAGNLLSNPNVQNVPGSYFVNDSMTSGHNLDKDNWRPRLTASASKAGVPSASYDIKGSPESYYIDKAATLGVNPAKDDWRQRLVASGSKAENSSPNPNAQNVHGSYFVNESMTSGLNLEKDDWRQRLTASAGKAGNPPASHNIKGSPESYYVDKAATLGVDSDKEDWRHRLIASAGKAGDPSGNYDMHKKAAGSYFINDAAKPGLNFDKEDWKQSFTASAGKVEDPSANYDLQRSPGSYFINEAMTNEVNNENGDWRQRLTASAGKVGNLLTSYDAQRGQEPYFIGNTATAGFTLGKDDWKQRSIASADKGRDPLGSFNIKASESYSINNTLTLAQNRDNQGWAQRFIASADNRGNQSENDYAQKDSGFYDVNNSLSYQDSVEKMKRTRNLAKDESMPYEMRVQVDQLCLDNENLNNLIINIREELRIWKEKAIILERSQPVLEELETRLDRLTAENRRLSQELMEKIEYIKELEKTARPINETKSQIDWLSSEKSRLEMIVTNLKKDVPGLNQKSTLLEKPVISLKPQMVAGESDDQFKLLMQENRRLVQVIDENTVRIKDMSQELSSLKRLGLSVESKVERPGANLTSFKFDGDDSDVDGDESEIGYDFDTLGDEDKIGLLVEEVERLQRKITQKNKVIELIKNKLANLEWLGKQHGDNQQRMEILLEENDRLNRALQTQMSSGNQNILNKQHREDYENTKIAILNTEIERLHRALEEKNYEIELATSKDSNRYKENYTNDKTKSLEVENENLRNTLARKVQEADELRLFKLNMQRQLEVLIDDNQRLNNELEIKERKCEALLREHGDVSGVKNIIKELEGVIIGQKQENQKLERQLKERNEELRLLRSTNKLINTSYDPSTSHTTYMQNQDINKIYQGSSVSMKKYI